jgi:hypothetical protein
MNHKNLRDWMMWRRIWLMLIDTIRVAGKLPASSLHVPSIYGVICTVMRAPCPTMRHHGVRMRERSDGAASE